MFIVLVGAGQNDIPLQYLPTYQPPGSHICLIDPTIDDDVYAALLGLGDDNTIISQPFDRSLIVPERDTFVICYTEEVPLDKVTSPTWTTIYCPHSSHGFPLETLETRLGANDRRTIDELNVLRQDCVILYDRDKADRPLVRRYIEISTRIISLFTTSKDHPIVVQLLSGLLSSNGLFTSVGQLIYDPKKYQVTYMNLGEYRIKLVSEI